MGIKSLVINPGSTSTKIGVYEDETLLFDEIFRHSLEEISQFPTVESQKDFRKSKILELFASNNFNIHSLDMVVGRGGLLKPIAGGTYEVTDELLHDLEIGRQGKHACNLGGILAREIADEIGVKSFIVDPPVVDEMIDVARISGVPELPRISAFHVLNQKAVAKRFAKENDKNYEDINLIVVHMGGGVSVGAHEKGKVVDVFNALDGDGALSTDRAGCVPSGALIKMCFSGKYTEKEAYKKIVGEGGIKAYLETNDMKKLDQMVHDGVKKAKLIRDAFIYQVSKNISALAAVLKGKVDQIIMTGGIAYDKFVVEGLKEAIEWIAPITVYPGEDELLALAQGGLRVMRKEEQAQVY